MRKLFFVYVRESEFFEKTRLIREGKDPLRPEFSSFPDAVLHKIRSGAVRVVRHAFPFFDRFKPLN